MRKTDLSPPPIIRLRPGDPPGDEPCDRQDRHDQHPDHLAFARRARVDDRGDGPDVEDEDDQAENAAEKVHRDGSVGKGARPAR